MYSWGWWWWKWVCFALILEARIQNTPSPPQWRCQARWTELSRWTLVMTSSACKPTNATSVSMLHCSNLSKQYGKTQENRTFWSWTMYQIRVTNINIGQLRHTLQTNNATHVSNILWKWSRSRTWCKVWSCFRKATSDHIWGQDMLTIRVILKNTFSKKKLGLYPHVTLWGLYKAYPRAFFCRTSLEGHTT